jgi:O-antigen/teichoic acid export membrane protein
MESGRGEHVRRLLFGSAWSGMALVFAQGSTFLGTLVAVRLLGREAFGAYAAALATVQFGSAILSVWLGGVAMKYIAELRQTNPERAGRFLGFSLVASWTSAVLGALCLVVAAPVLATRIFHQPALQPLLRLAAPALLFAAANLGLGGMLAGLAAFRLIGRLGVWAGIGYLTFVSAGLLSMGPRGAVLGIGVAGLVQFSLGAWLVAGEVRRQNIPVRFRLAPADRRLWQEFSVPSALIGLTGPSALWLVQVAIARRPLTWSRTI